MDLLVTISHCVDNFIDTPITELRVTPSVWDILDLNILVSAHRTPGQPLLNGEALKMMSKSSFFKEKQETGDNVLNIFRENCKFWTNSGASFSDLAVFIPFLHFVAWHPTLNSALIVGNWLGGGQ
jgi:hypothetical protein